MRDPACISSTRIPKDHMLNLPMGFPRGVKGAAAAACEEIALVLLGAEIVAGVNEGESTFNAFFILVIGSANNIRAVIDSKECLQLRRK